jgi:presequence protease
MAKRNYIENLEYLQSHIGGLSMALSLYTQVESSHQLKPALTVRGKALDRNVRQLFSIFNDLLLHARLDETKRIEELLLQIHTGLQQRLQKNSLRYASQLALSSLSPAAKIAEKWQGLSYVKWIQTMVSDPSKLFTRLPKLKDQLLAHHKPQLILTCDEAMHQLLERENYFGVLELAQKSFIHWCIDFGVEPIESQARPIATPVAFTCEAFKVTPYLHPHAPALTVATHLLENKVLFPKIREQGGAYGCGATYAAMGGFFTLHAYRDPRIASTIKVFKEAIAQIAKGNFEPSDLDSAKLETIQQFDSPIAPGSRGAAAYGWFREGKTLAHRQHFRDRLLDLTPHEIVLAVKKELIDKPGTVVTFASKELLEKENSLLEKPLPIIPI